MYRVALIQNQSEAFELSYGDLYTWFSNAFPSYDWDLFSTERSMSILFERLSSRYYDAIVFTTNTLNDLYLRNAWRDQGHRIAKFLESGGGILVFQQIKIAGEMLDMFPENLQVGVEQRPRTEDDDLRNDKLSVKSDHLILHYPKQVHTESIVADALKNPTIEYLYWSYLLPKSPEFWLEVLSDDARGKHRRPLLLVSGPQTHGRVVVTSLVLDWQRQLTPLSNLLSYVVEGPHSMAVIRREGRSSYDFNYLVRNLRINKHGLREYTMDTLDFTRIAPMAHDVVILDSTWRPDEITRDNMTILRQSLKSHGRLIYFDEDSLGEPSIISVGGALPFAVRYQQAINFLKESFDRSGGRWDGSYFSTIHVLEALVALGESVEEYKDSFLEYVFPHDVDGAYDRQFATTCALLKVYHMFLGIRSARYKKTVTWLNREISGDRKVDTDHARAFLTLSECGKPVSLDRVRELQQRQPSARVESEEELYRYIRLFLEYELIEELLSYASKLITKQRDDGSWGFEERNRLFLTGLIVDLLLSVRDAVSGRALELRDVDDAILRAMTYLKPIDLSIIPQKDKCSTVAAVLQAIHHFEQRIRFPIDEFLTEQAIVAKGNNVARARETANRLITNLQTERVQLAADLKVAVQDVASSRAVANRMGWFVTICIPILVISLFIIVILGLQQGAAAVLSPVTSLDPGWIYAFVGFMIVLFGVMYRRNLLPERLAKSLRRAADVLESPTTALRSNKDREE